MKSTFAFVLFFLFVASQTQTPSCFMVATFNSVNQYCSYSSSYSIENNVCYCGDGSVCATNVCCACPGELCGSTETTIAHGYRYYGGTVLTGLITVHVVDTNDDYLNLYFFDQSQIPAFQAGNNTNYYSVPSRLTIDGCLLYTFESAVYYPLAFGFECKNSYETCDFYWEVLMQPTTTSTTSTTTSTIGCDCDCEQTQCNQKCGKDTNNFSCSIVGGSASVVCQCVGAKSDASQNLISVFLVLLFVLFC